MWNASVRSAEHRDDGKFYVIVDFVNGSEKRAKEYLITSGKTMEGFKSQLRSDIDSFSVDREILSLRPGVIDLAVESPKAEETIK